VPIEGYRYNQQGHRDGTSWRPCSDPRPPHRLVKLQAQLFWGAGACRTWPHTKPGRTYEQGLNRHCSPLVLIPPVPLFPADLTINIPCCAMFRRELFIPLQSPALCLTSTKEGIIFYPCGGCRGATCCAPTSVEVRCKAQGGPWSIRQLPEPSIEGWYWKQRAEREACSWCFTKSLEGQIPWNA
jgi:hypothetical protein